MTKSLPVVGLLLAVGLAGCSGSGNGRAAGAAPTGEEDLSFDIVFLPSLPAGGRGC